MQILHEKPPADLYKRIQEKFPVDFEKGIIITYGEDVYCKYDLSTQKVVHEMVHTIQQSKMGKDIWWNKYFEDEWFRLSQELEAYQEEAKFLKQSIKDRNKKFMAIRQIAQDLSGPIYGNIITYNEAFKLLNNG